MILKFTTPRPSPSFEIQTDFGRIWEGAFIKCFRGKPLQWGGALDELRLYTQNPPLTDLLPARTKISEIVPRRKFWRSSFQSLASIPIPSQSLFVAKTQLFPSPTQTMLAWIYQWNSKSTETFWWILFWFLLTCWLFFLLLSQGGRPFWHLQ